MIPYFKVLIDRLADKVSMDYSRLIKFQNQTDQI